MRCELETRFKQIQTRLKAVCEETDEVSVNHMILNTSVFCGPSDLRHSKFKQITFCLVRQAHKHMLTAQSSLLESISDNDLDPSSGSFQEGSTENLTAKPSVARRRANLQDVENLYITVSLFVIINVKRNKLVL